MPRKRISPRQRAQLVEAKTASTAYEAFRAIYEWTRELQQDDLVSPEWQAIWERWKASIIEEVSAPSSIIERIEKMLAGVRPIDADVAKIRVQPDERVVFLLGAGASAPTPSSIPTVSKLLEEMWRRAKKLGREDVDRLADWCDSHGVVNIEDLLTAAYLANFAARQTTVTGLLDYFLFTGGTSEQRPGLRRRMPQAIDVASVAHLSETLQTIFGLLTGVMIPARPNVGHDAVVRFVQAHSLTSIVTTNYDGCIDESLLNANVSTRTYLRDEPSSAEEGTDLIKMHGSINWSYCDSCQEVRQFSLPTIKEAFEKDTLSYAVIGICKTCGGQRRPLLVPPLAMKFIMFPNLIKLWNMARNTIEGARYLIVVGYSFSEADTYITKIISRSMTANPAQRMVVCDTDAELVLTLREKFAAIIDNFDPLRVLQAMGSCDEVLQEILPGMVKDKSEVTVQQQKDGHRGGRAKTRASKK